MNFFLNLKIKWNLDNKKKRAQKLSWVSKFIFPVTLHSFIYIYVLIFSSFHNFNVICIEDKFLLMFYIHLSSQIRMRNELFFGDVDYILNSTSTQKYSTLMLYNNEYEWRVHKFKISVGNPKSLYSKLSFSCH